MLGEMLPADTGLYGSVKGDCQREMVGHAGGRTQIEDAEVRVAGDGGEERGRVRGKGGRVGAGVCG